MPFKDKKIEKSYFQEYYLKHREHKKMMAKDYWWNNREQRMAKHKEWSKNHPGYNTQHNREWRAANPERFRATVEQYQPRCNELQRIRKQRERQENPERVRIMEKVYSFRRDAQGHITASDINFIIERDNWRCGICHRRVNKSEFSIDHILPISFGGTNAVTNLRLAHFRCNARRSNHGSAQLRIIA